MFVFNRSAVAVLLPLALLLAVVLWSNRADGLSAPAAQKVAPARPALVAQTGEEPRQGG